AGGPCLPLPCCRRFVSSRGRTPPTQPTKATPAGRWSALATRKLGHHEALQVVPQIRRPLGIFRRVRGVSISRGSAKRTCGLIGDAGSTFTSLSTSSYFGFSFASYVWPSGTSPGSGLMNRWSYRRTSASTAWAADTQWIVPLTLRPSGALPPRVWGSYVQRSSVIRPEESFTTSLHVMK